MSIAREDTSVDRRNITSWCQDDGRHVFYSGFSMSSYHISLSFRILIWSMRSIELGDHLQPSGSHIAVFARLISKPIHFSIDLTLQVQGGTFGTPKT